MVDFVDRADQKNIIELKNIGQSYDGGQHWIMKDLNFIIEDKPGQGQFVVILGMSGSGKSTSIENLNPQETVLINVVGKDLPFRGWKSKYPTYDKATKQGNSWEVNDSLSIVTVLKHVSDNMPHVKTIIIDDFQYVMSYEFMKRAKEKGYEKFTEIAQNAFNVINTSKNLRSDLNVFYL